MAERNAALASARKAKNDEFYTLYGDVEREMAYYRSHFRGEAVFCGCDDPARSAFWRYFHANFAALGLERLEAAYFGPGRPAFSYFYDGGDDADIAACAITPMDGDGDFRSAGCAELLERCGIAATNPPFSLFREYMDMLARSGKKFVIVGSLGAAAYKNVFPLLRDGSVWLGRTHPKTFMRPDGSTRAFGNTVWYTNLDVPERHAPLELAASYYQDPAAYPRYDNYGAVECSRVRDIPGDYHGAIGVPLTFLEKHCPEQFDVLGITKSWDGLAVKKYGPQLQIGRDGSRKACLKLNDQPVLPRPPGHAGVYYEHGGREYIALYQRVLIRRRGARVPGQDA